MRNPLLYYRRRHYQVGDVERSTCHSRMFPALSILFFVFSLIPCITKKIKDIFHKLYMRLEEEIWIKESNRVEMRVMYVSLIQTQCSTFFSFHQMIPGIDVVSVIFYLAIGLSTMNIKIV
jgi:hypothetical protein